MVLQPFSRPPRGERPSFGRKNHLPETLALATLSSAPPVDEASQGLIQHDGSSPVFFELVQKTLTQALPAKLITDLKTYGYSVRITDHLTQNRPELSADLNLTGGLHDHGPILKAITIAEKVWSKLFNRWDAHTMWQNAVFHELGHALAISLGQKPDKALELKDQQAVENDGLSEHPFFRWAYEYDFNQMPDTLKKQHEVFDPQTESYFLAPDTLTTDNTPRTYVRARKEAFAEGFDILCRAKESSQNFAFFTRYFPHTLTAIASLLQQTYPTLNWSLKTSAP